MGKHWVFKRVVDEWNNLPSRVIEAKTLGSFKKTLDKYMTGKGLV